MKIGIIGLAKSGKTTLFNALTRSKVDTAGYEANKMEPNIAIISVEDQRVDELTAICQPEKKVYATIEFIDFLGLAEGAAKAGLFSSASTTLIKNTDALALVLRNYQDDFQKAAQPLIDLGKIEEELLLSDLISAEGRLERIELGYKRGQKTPALQAEEKVLRKIREQLNANQPIRALELKEEEEKLVRGFQFLTLKPWMIVLNSGEKNLGQNRALLDEILRKHPAIEFAGKFEMELAQLSDPAEAELFMQDMGIAESARKRLTLLAYEVLGYITFFTIGSDEVRAWTIRKGENALEAAGTIHSDLARGFIRAESFTYDDLIACGSEKGVKEKGRLRLEGKSYIVQDGDIMHIRFNV
ncbi:MAG: redox-regulated ATPase YchF [Desulfobacteraceae bacterium]|nr:MAG: redox-regulated ATPase YchF [Desulfobacteraceae bacterium]